MLSIRRPVDAGKQWVFPPDSITDSADLSRHRDVRTLQLSDDEHNQQPCPTSQSGGTILINTGLPETTYAESSADPFFRHPFRPSSRGTTPPEETLDTSRSLSSLSALYLSRAY